MRSTHNLALWLIMAVMLPRMIFASFNAYVDSQKIKSNESFTLTLEFKGKPSAEPDLSPLLKDFSIDSRETSTESSFVNGNFTATTRWTVELFPKKAASELIIPSITLDRFKTAPIKLVVSEDKMVSTSGTLVRVFTEQKEVYVNAELLLHIEMKTSEPFRSGSITKPEIKDAIVEPLGEDTRAQYVENGVRYTVYRRNYAVFPSKPGVLTIPSIYFKGAVAVAPSGMRGFFSQGKEISARSEEIAITVKDVPKDFPAGHSFLPLKSFVIIESLDKADAKFEVGKAINRRFEMKAKGTLASFLPVINPPSVLGLQVYSENGEKIHKNLEDGIEASTKFSHVYMPASPGSMRVPEQTIYWWDTDSDKLRTTIIRALDIEIAGQAMVMPPVQKSEEQVPQEPDAIKALPSKDPEVSSWMLVSLALMVLWLLTVIFFLWSRARKPAPQTSTRVVQQSMDAALQEIASMCAQGDMKAVLRALLAMRAKTPLGAVLDDRIAELEKALYEQQASSDQSALLLKIKQDIKKFSGKQEKSPKLLGLYPRN